MKTYWLSSISFSKKFDKNQYNHLLQDIGHIDTQRRRDFEKAIPKDKK